MPKQDAGYKLLFSHTAMVRDFLRAYFPGDRSRVRTEDIEAVQKISGAWIDEILFTHQNAKHNDGRISIHSKYRHDY